MRRHLAGLTKPEHLDVIENDVIQKKLLLRKCRRGTGRDGAVTASAGDHEAGMSTWPSFSTTSCLRKEVKIGNSRPTTLINQPWWTKLLLEGATPQATNEKSYVVRIRTY